jgi:Zn-finger domain-containing protein
MKTKFNIDVFDEWHRELLSRLCFKDGKTFESGYRDCIAHELNKVSLSIRNILSKYAESGSLINLFKACKLLYHELAELDQLPRFMDIPIEDLKQINETRGMCHAMERNGLIPKYDDWKLREVEDLA